MLVHGANDTMITPRHAYQLYRAAQSPKELWLVSGVEHCGAYFLDRAHYVERMARFFAQI
jgi:uncharacterized protein